MKISYFFMVTLLSVTIGFSSVANANTEIDKFASCLVDNLNGKERKLLAKWIFFAMAAHPEIKDYSSVTSEQVDDVHKNVGSIINRLMLDNCPNELKAANSSNPQAIQKAFEFVGQVAMQELLTNQDVTGTLTGYLKYTNEGKIQELLIK